MSTFTKDTRTVRREVRTGVEISLEELLEIVDRLEFFVDSDDFDGEDVTVRFGNDYGFSTVHEADAVTVTVPAGKGRKVVDLDDVILKIEFAEGNGPDDDEEDC